MSDNTKYYLIKGRIIGKMVDYNPFIYDDGWKPDTGSMIIDRLLGFDPFEPPGSPYCIGNTDVMEEIEEIPKETAMAYTGGIA